LDWEASQGVERGIWRDFRSCVDTGIWGFVSKYGYKEAKKSRRRGSSPGNKAEEDEDEEEEMIEELEDDVTPRREKGFEPKVSERGWEVLAWFCDVWEKDALERAQAMEGVLRHDCLHS
jgi:hypothetical protein